MKTAPSNKVKTAQRVTSLFHERIVFGVVTLLMAMASAGAKDGRDFAGFYSVIFSASKARRCNSP
jgi:hypothetical protein